MPKITGTATSISGREWFSQISKYFQMWWASEGEEKEEHVIR